MTGAESFVCPDCGGETFTVWWGEPVPIPGTSQLHIMCRSCDRFSASVTDVELHFELGRDH